MTSSKKQKEKIKNRIRLSNEAEKNGLPPDKWVVDFRAKNNAIKVAWKAKQPKKEIKKKLANSGSFKNGAIPANKKSEKEREDSILRWRAATKKWHNENRDRVNELARIRKQINPDIRIKANLRKRLSYLLRLSLVKKTEQTMDLLGCSLDFFKSYLSSLFTEGMSFDNYGKWHLDHKKPCYYFDLTKEEDRAVCFHYTNIQPMWAIDNLKKNKRMS
jgi:hypothetical protein